MIHGRSVNPAVRKLVSVNSLMIVAGCGLLIYTFLRAYLLSFTHDESLTWLWFVHLSVPDIFLNAKVTGNNHILNTLLMKGLSTLFGDSELVLRLPGLAGQVLYLVFSIRILQGVRNPWVRLLGFTILNVNPYLLDFFSLARGYGLSLGMMVALLYFQVQWMASGKEKFLITSLAFLTAGILANIAMTSLLPAAWALTFLRMIPLPGTMKTGRLRAAMPFIRANLWFIASLVILVLLLWVPVSRLIQENRIDYGGSTGFWYDTVTFLFKKSCYDLSYRHAAASGMNLLLTISLAAAFVACFVKWRRSRTFPWDHPLCFLSLLLLLSAAGAVLQRSLFGTPYLHSRTALTLWPVIVLVPVFLPDPGSSRSLVKRISSGLSASLIILISVNFALSANLTHTLEWRFDADTETMLEELPRGSASPDKLVVIGCSWVFEPTLNFYRQSKELNWLKEITREGPFINSDFRYVLPADADSLVRRSEKPFRRYPVSGNTLFTSGF